MTYARDAEPYQAARELLDQQRFAEALAVYEDLANAGDPQCQVQVGWMYHEGCGVLQDQEKARSWFHRAASMGSKEGAFYYGRSVAAVGRYQEAIEWFHKAAAHEYGPALLWLGIANVRGLGIQADFKKGVEYIERAAKTGNVFALRELGFLMMRGKLGVSKVPLGLVIVPYAVIVGIVTAVLNHRSEKITG